MGKLTISNISTGPWLPVRYFHKLPEAPKIEWTKSLSLNSIFHYISQIIMVDYPVYYPLLSTSQIKWWIIDLTRDNPPSQCPATWQAGLYPPWNSKFSEIDDKKKDVGPIHSESIVNLWWIYSESTSDIGESIVNLWFIYGESIPIIYHISTKCKLSLKKAT